MHLCFLKGGGNDSAFVSSMSVDLVSRHLGVGDIFPYVQLKTADGRPRAAAQFAGQPLLVHLCATRIRRSSDKSALASHSALEPGCLSGLLEAARKLVDLGVRLLVISPDGDQTARNAICSQGGSETEVVWLQDPMGTVAKMFNSDESGATFLLNENQRVLAIFDSRTVPLDGESLLSAARMLLPERRFFESKVHAPVLRVPGVFDPDCCRKLIEIFENSPHEASGFNEQRNDGAPVVFDDKVKRRRDFVVGAGTPLAEQIRVIYMRRLIPEIAKAFHFEVNSHEAFKIARYDSEDKGFFLRHRDNTNSATSHRRFAVSINLNAEEHEGGHLVFPEYCEAGYRPATGEALVFCCSVLHEARPVTQGRRYVQLAFLY